jgi:hypothetical protein
VIRVHTPTNIPTPAASPHHLTPLGAPFRCTATRPLSAQHRHKGLHSSAIPWSPKECIVVSHHSGWGWSCGDITASTSTCCSPQHLAPLWTSSQAQSATHLCAEHWHTSLEPRSGWCGEGYSGWGWSCKTAVPSLPRPTCCSPQHLTPLGTSPQAQTATRHLTAQHIQMLPGAQNWGCCEGHRG